MPSPNPRAAMLRPPMIVRRRDRVRFIARSGGGLSF
jgi:hypothetical protein